MKRRKADYATSDETREVLNGKETKIAKSYGCEPAYIFNIKNGHEHGINPTVNLTEKLLSKIDTDYKSTHILAQSIADNYLDQRECEQILEACDRMKDEEQGLRELALNRLNELKVKK